MEKTEMISKEDQFVQMIHKLISLSKADKYDVFNDIEWPDFLEDEQLWMSEELLTIYDTQHMNSLSQSQIYKLSKWECINFFSLNIHGIRDLLREVLKYIHTPGFELVSDFFHHFFDEENEHMYYFARFCKTYGGKIYKDKRVNIEQFKNNDVQLFLVFIKILVFEEIVDYFNYKMSKDEKLHPFIRLINGLHHKVESRHIAFGNKFVIILFNALQEKLSVDEISKLRSYVKSYIKFSIELLYNPEAYRDAGILDPYLLRTELLSSSSRRECQYKPVQKIVNKLYKDKVIEDTNVF